MKQPSFLRLGKQRQLDNETAYTIVRLIDAVGFELKQDWHWKWLEGVHDHFDAIIDRSLLDEAWDLLLTRKHLSLQRATDSMKPISTLTPLDGLTDLRSLIFSGNLVSDLEPLAGMQGLKALSCDMNRIHDLTSLKLLQELQDVSLGKNPLVSMSVLEALPNLRNLAISNDQVMKLMGCKLLPALQSLGLDGMEPVKDFQHFPELPSLTVLRASGLADIAGIERFQSLTTLDLHLGHFSSLEGLSGLKHLTHIAVSSSKPISVKPIKRLYKLRRLTVNSPSVHDLSALHSLPVLHDLRVNIPSHGTRREIAALRKELTGWEVEFADPAKGATPSLRLEVVSQESFDRYDGKDPFGVRPGECEDGMMHSEREWVVGEICDTLEGVGFREDIDFILPNRRAFCRSTTLAIYTLRAYEGFRSVVTAVQKTLCATRNDWIVFLQSLLEEGSDAAGLPQDHRDFKVWIYQDKVIAPQESASLVRRLIEWRSND